MADPSPDLLRIWERVTYAKHALAPTDGLLLTPPDINDHTRFVLGRVTADVERLLRLLNANIADIHKQHTED